MDRQADDRRVPLTAAAVLVLAVAAGATALWLHQGNGHAPSALRVYNTSRNSAGVTIGGVPAQTPYVYVVYPLCTKGGPVTITKVLPVHPQGGIEVVGWAVNPDAKRRPQRQTGCRGTRKPCPGSRRLL